MYIWIQRGSHYIHCAVTCWVFFSLNNMPWTSFHVNTYRYTLILKTKAYLPFNSCILLPWTDILKSFFPDSSTMIMYYLYDGNIIKRFLETTENKRGTKEGTWEEILFVHIPVDWGPLLLGGYLWFWRAFRAWLGPDEKSHLFHDERKEVQGLWVFWWPCSVQGPRLREEACVRAEVWAGTTVTLIEESNNKTRNKTQHKNNS